VGRAACKDVIRDDRRRGVKGGTDGRGVRGDGGQETSCVGSGSGFIGEGSAGGGRYKVDIPEEGSAWTSERVFHVAGVLSCTVSPGRYFMGAVSRCSMNET